ncbi:MAG TPA: translocation/assembly module TamB domain-containing protein, partial [Polyangiaceae bacterium]|nr:translocation/assembly module TamB domain-containing protein [Polyangiaceae bacterium]
ANPWQASGSAELFRFPLASIPALAESQVAGSASGKLSFTGLGRDPEVLGQIELRDVMVERAAFPQGQVHLRVAKNGIVASAKLDQADGGGASATASARLEWPSPVVPAIDHGAPVDLYLDARAFRAAALYPLLFRGVFTYFDGDLRGTLHLHEEKRNEAVKQTVEGAFELKDGIFQIPEIGQEFRKATAQIRVAEGGQVEVSDVAASGVTGRLTASGSMQLKGFSFVSGEGTLRVAEKEAVPLTLEGVSVGDAFGTLMLHAKMDGDHTVKVDVDVPVFHTDIPESSSRDVQALADHDGIRVGIGDGEGKLVPVALGVPQAKRADDALSWHLTFYLGQDVKLTRGQTMRMVLGGQPVVDLTDEARVSGSVEFRSGAVEVFGKTFEIEHGVARFEGDDPGNPYVNVTARWDGPDATRIFVDYVGPLRTGVLGLRSEPARSRADILAILLFGTAETASPAAGFTTQTRGTANAGTALALGQVSTGVNQVLSNVVPSKLTTRVSSDARGPTPEVAYQLSPKVTAQLSFRTRKPTLNELPDRILLTLDWRFRRNWSVTVTRGDAGRSVLDLIWQYRY